MQLQRHVTLYTRTLLIISIPVKSNIYCLSVSACNKVTVARCGVEVFRCFVWFGVLCCVVVWCGVQQMRGFGDGGCVEMP